MKDNMTDEVLQARSDALVDSLFQEAIQGNEDAAEELSKIAMGGASKRAKDLIRLMDCILLNPQEKIETSHPVPVRQEPQPKINTLAWVARHPGEAIRAGVRQIFVAIEHEAPPHTSTFEEFPELPIDKAAEAIRLAGTPKMVGGGVRKEDWPYSDQERMANGLRPQGHPEHPNI